MALIAIASPDPCTRSGPQRCLTPFEILTRAAALSEPRVTIGEVPDRGANFHGLYDGGDAIRVRKGGVEGAYLIRSRPLYRTPSVPNTRFAIVVGTSKQGLNKPDVVEL
jgi:hypothetical protein